MFILLSGKISRPTDEKSNKSISNKCMYKSMSDNIYYVWVILKELIKIQIYVITRFISIFGFMPDLINRLYCSAEEIVIKTSKIINGMAKVQI